MAIKDRDIRDALETLDTEIENLEAQIKDKDEELADLENEVEDLKSQVEVYQERIKELEEALAESYLTGEIKDADLCDSGHTRQIGFTQETVERTDNNSEIGSDNG